MIIDTLKKSLETGVKIKVTKKSGATITGTVKLIANAHFVLKCHLGSIAIFSNSVEDVSCVTKS